ncbi:MAG: UbiX family flavin prenyltransferase [Acidimicrobiia bacterium]
MSWSSVDSPPPSQEHVTRRIVVGISGSSGAIYGARLVEVLSGMEDVETHLIISDGAKATIEYETPYSVDQVVGMADVAHDDRSMGASIASGTFITDGMVVAPCSIKTLSSVASSFAGNLITRAADVTLKESRRLVLVVRETPLHRGHLRLMSQAAESGAVILPPVPGFYTRPSTIEQIVDHTITKILDQFGLDAGLIERWAGLS